MAPSAEIPVIDIAAEGVSEAQIAQALVDAAAEQGFIYIKSTGKALPVDQIENAFSIVSSTMCPGPQRKRGWLTVDIVPDTV